MEKFKNTIVIGCICIAILVLQSICISSQSTPLIILNLAEKMFLIVRCIAAAIFAFALVVDCKNYILSRY